MTESEALEAGVGETQDGGAKLRQIMDGARAVFLSAGFDGASMNDIARGAGVSKGTLYAYFDSKVDLFEAIIREMRAEQAERHCAVSPELGDARAVLTDFGVRLMEKITNPERIALARLVIAAAGKFPRLGRAFYEAGPAYGARRLAAELVALERAGALKVPDAERAATQFVDLCQSGLFKRVLFAMVDSVSREEIEAAVGAGVDVFLAAYGVKNA